MKKMSGFTAILVLLALTALLRFSVALAQSGSGYDLTWSTVDGGGHTWSEGISYALGGAAGQPDAGVLSGASYTLAGGLWGGATAQYRVYLPLALRNH